MADAKSDYLEKKVLDHALGTASFTMPSGVYASLHSEDPTDDGSGTEVSGGSYSRKAVTFVAATTVAGVTSAANSSDVIWTNLPTVTVTHVGLWDASTGGNLLYHAGLSAPKVISTGDGYTISTSLLKVTEN